MKKTVIFLLSLLLLSLSTLPCAYASGEADTTEKKCIFILGSTDYQEYIITDDSGNLITVSVSFTPLLTNKNEKDPVTNGVYTISASSPYLSLSFKVLITNYSIISVYDGQYSSIVYTITSSNLSRISLKEAKYTVSCQGAVTSFTKWLKCEINSSNELVVTNNL